jgi:diphthamide biosynthesis methyltransferase
MTELGFNDMYVSNCLKENKHNHATTTYYLLVKSAKKKMSKSGKVEKLLALINNGKIFTLISD